jgi:hypothetical protein
MPQKTSIAVKTSTGNSKTIFRYVSETVSALATGLNDFSVVQPFSFSGWFFYPIYSPF